MLFDSHAHLCDARFDEDRRALISALFKEEGLAGFIECATGKDDIDAALNLSREWDRVYAAAGVHPHEAGDWDSDMEDRLTALWKNGEIVAIGEIGLDYHYDFNPRSLQREVLARQLELAASLSAPVILHNRESTADMLDALTDAPAVKGVMHCFSGSVDTLHKLLEMGLYIGFGGSLTFKNNKKGIAAALATPLNRILLETDSPYLAPVPLRGTRNYPANTRYVAALIAELRGIAQGEVEEAAYENARVLFGVK